MRSTICATMFMLFSTSTALAQQIGDKVEVVGTNVTLKVEAKNGAAIPMGTSLTVKQVNGEWLWVEYGNDKGWIKKGETKLSRPNAIGVQKKARKIYGPVIVTIDRRPLKDVVYSKCIGSMISEDNLPYYFVIEPMPDGRCPLLEEISVLACSDLSVCDSGRTEIRNVDMTDEVFSLTPVHNGDKWRYNVLPAKVTVTVPSFTDPTKDVTDSFFIARVRQMPQDTKRITIACDDCSTLEQAFKTALPTKELRGDDKVDASKNKTTK